MENSTLRLIDLDNVSSNKPDIAIIMTEIIGYNNFYIGRKYRFRKAFRKAYFLLREARNINPKNVLMDNRCKIKVPDVIDNITFRAMMELKSILGGNLSKNSYSEYMALIITVACYSENNNGEYSSSSIKFKRFYNRIMQSPLWQMVGIFNHIESEVLKSNLEWEKRFLSVAVDDEDYEKAGGNRMQQFNVINTIKNVCNDFNLSYEKAWQISYSLTQTNSYAKATANHIQEQMRILKEIKMKASRKK